MASLSIDTPSSNQSLETTFEVEQVDTEQTPAVIIFLVFLLAVIGLVAVVVLLSIQVDELNTLLEDLQEFLVLSKENGQSVGGQQRA